MTVKRFFAVMMAPLLLSACQHTPPPAPNVNSTSEQLSSLVGAAHYLREHCNRADIPDDQQLAAVALAEARKKSGSAEFSQDQLVAAGKKVAAQLDADATPVKVKCSGLNRSLAPFLLRVR